MRNKFTALAQLACAGIARAGQRHAARTERYRARPWSNWAAIRWCSSSSAAARVWAWSTRLMSRVVTSVLEALNLLQYDVLLQRYYPTRGAD